MPKEAIVRYFELSSKSRPSPHWIKFAAASLMAIAIAGCGGGGSTGANTPVGVGANTVPASATAAAAWKTLVPQVKITGVSIPATGAGTPVVNFTVTDSAGKAVTGLTGYSQASTAIVKKLTNVAFTLAKFVPAAAGEPSTWVSMLVVRPPTKAEQTATPGTSSCNAATGATWCGTYPTSDSEGALVDNGGGSYTYTFYRDVKQTATIVTSLIDSTDNLSKKADLGNVSFDPAGTYRVGIQIGGAAPGTGSNLVDPVTLAPVPTAAAPASVSMVNTGNAWFDFRADGVALTASPREVVKIETCAACHDGKVLAHGSRKDPNYCVTCHTDQIKYSFNGGDSAVAADGITFVAPATTLTTAQKRAAYAIVDGRAVGNYPNMIHKVHMGKELVKQGYNFNNNNGAMLFNTVGLPQDPANCSTCHIGAANGVKTAPAQGANWNSAPSALACGSCHDGINFTTGAGITLADRDKDVAAKVAVGTTKSGHLGGPLADNSRCAECHKAGGLSDIAVAHRTNYATPNNPVATAGLASFAYDIKSVTVDATTGQPTIVFQIKKDGVAVTSLPVAPLVTHATSGQQVVDPAYEPIPGFTSGPSIYFAYAVPQDGITAPADFNVQKSVSLTNLLIASGSPKAGSVTGPDANGYFTAVVTGDTLGQVAGTGCVAPVAPATATCVVTAVTATPLVIPAAAKMVTGAIIGSFTQKTGPGITSYVNANVSVNNAKVTASLPGVTPVVVGVNAGTVSASGGQARPAMLKKLVATGYTARRVIVDTAKCATCHDQLGTSPSFHSGARNDATACAICHNNTQTSGGWSSNSNTFIHGIHGASKRTVGYTWQVSLGYSTLGYPGVLKDCNQCHAPNTVNLGATGTAIAPNMLWPTVATGTTAVPPAVAASNSISPYIAQTAGTKYGLGFSYTTPGQAYSTYTLVDGVTVVPAGTAGATGYTRPAEGTTLVSSPLSSACFSCHDTSAAKAHMTTNGGAIYEARSTAFSKSEACLTCHGAGKVVDAAAVHQ